MLNKKINKIKLLNVITNSSPFGGAQMVLFNNVTNNPFHNVVISGNEGILTKKLRENKVEVIIIDKLKRNFSLYDFYVFFKLLSILKSKKFDFVISHSSKIGVLARLACFITKTKNAFVVHGWSFSNDNSKIAFYFYLYVEKIMKYFTNHFILVSNYDLKIGIKKKIISKQNHTLIYNGSKDFSTSNRKLSHSNKLVISFVARFSKQKDHETLFKALTFLNENTLNKLTINLIGGGKYTYKNIPEKITNSLNFVGETSDVHKYLIKSNLFMLISNYEGLPVSIIEALSLGLPVIASDVGGINELVKEGVNGFLVKKKDSVTLSNILNKLLNNESDNLIFMGNNSRKIYEKNFKVELMVEKTKNLILNKLNIDSL